MSENLAEQIMNFMKQFCGIVKGFSDGVVGLGACSWHSIGQELLIAYKNGDQRIIDFVNNELLKSYAEKYKDKTPDFANFKNYPMEVLEFNKILNTEFYKAYLMFFEGAYIQNYNRVPDFIRGILKDYSLDKRTCDAKKDNNKYIAYKKYIFDPIFNFGDNYLEINIDYDKLFGKLEDLRKDKSLDLTTKIIIITRINDIISSSLENDLTYTKIIYDFDNNWFLKDQDGYKINPDLLKDAWQSYRIGNILGQVFREHLCALKKDREQSKKSGSKSNSDNTNKIIDALPDVKKLEKPFIGQTADEINNCLALIAQKTEKSSIIFGFEKHDKDTDKDQIDIDKYSLDIIDDKTKTVKNYQIKFIGDEIHIYNMKNIPAIKLEDEQSGKRLLVPEIKDLLNKIKEIQKTKPFSFIRSPGHIENLNHDKENEFFNRIDKSLDFIAANERSKTKDVFCRVGKSFVVFAMFIGYCIIIATVIPIVIFLVFKKAIQKKQNQKLSQTQARSSVIESIVKQYAITEKLKEYIFKTKTADTKYNGKAKPNMNLSISQEQNFLLR